MLQQPAQAPDTLSGAPQSLNQQDALGDVSRESEAKRVAEFHRDGSRRKRFRDLTAEKYLLHYDGEGDAQWADIHHGERIAIPRNISGSIRVQENLLRPIVDNAVAYHTTMPFRFLADSQNDRDSRDRAYVDQALINYFSLRQNWNAVFSGAFLMACAYGHCPVHAFVRDDVAYDEYEPMYMPREAAEGLWMPRRIAIDAVCGDPWDTVYDAGARRHSVHQMTYGRVVPAEMVRRTFGVDVQGTTKMPSASRFQRISRQWSFTQLDIHGSATMHSGHGGDELIALVCREMAAGLDPEWPQGRLTVVALDGAASTDMADGSTKGRPVLLHDGPLPAGRFSAVRVYSMPRADDVLGKPLIADLDDIQVQLNQYLSRRAEFIRRATNPPLVRSGVISEDGAIWDDDAMLEVEQGSGRDVRFLEMPSSQIGVLNEAIQDCRQAMYTLGGYNAASRGESHAGDPAAKVVALARADDTIHGPTNARFREAVESFAALNWSLFKEYGDVAVLVDAAGKQFADLDDPYIDRTKISESVPSFRLTSTSGATPEARMDQLIGLVQMRGADGEPLITTQQFRAMFPDRSLFPEEDDLEDITEQRASFVARRMREMLLQVAEDPRAQQNPMIPQLAFQAIMQEYPPRPSDNIRAHVEEMIALVQDETEHDLVRQVAQMREMAYKRIAQQQMMQRMAAQAGAPQEGGSPAPSRNRPGADEAATGSTREPSQMARSIAPSSGTIQSLTEAAKRGQMQ